jgi:predicted XRE-type DNA-binding protein
MYNTYIEKSTSGAVMKKVVKSGSGNVFKDLGFDEKETIELKFKAELYVILKKTVEKQKLTSRQLEKIWDVPQPRVSEILTGKFDKVSITRLLTFLGVLGVKVQPIQSRNKNI